MQILHTKDSTKNGNAILVKEIEPTGFGMKEYLKGRPLWLVESDFGNRMKLTDREINEMFHRGPAADYSEWKAAKEDLRLRAIIEDDTENHP